MMDCNWLVKVADKDRAALRAYGVSPKDEAAMSHKEVVSALKARGFTWTPKAPL